MRRSRYLRVAGVSRNPGAYWEHVYATKCEQEIKWFQESQPLVRDR